MSYRLSAPDRSPTLNARHLTTLTLKQARRVAIFVVGATVALLGLVMLLTPGPGLAVILAGLAILAIEFAWARRLLADARARMRAAGQALRKRAGRGTTGDPGADPNQAAPGRRAGPGGEQGVELAASEDPPTATRER